MRAFGNKFIQFKQIVLHSLLHNNPTVKKGISEHRRNAFHSMLKVSKINKEGVSPVIKSDNKTISTSVNDDNKTHTSPISINLKENNGEIFTASINIENNVCIRKRNKWNIVLHMHLYY